jgi:hypothetical protein
MQEEELLGILLNNLIYISYKNNIFSQENKLDIIEIFRPLNFQGKVNLKNPDRTFMIIDNHYLGKKFFGRIIAGKSDGKN